MYDAHRESEPVGVLERHHRRHRLDLGLLRLLGRRDGLGQRIQPAGFVVTEDVQNPRDPLGQVFHCSPIHGLPLLEPGVDLVVGDVPLVRHGIRVDGPAGSVSDRVVRHSSPDCSGGTRLRDYAVRDYRHELMVTDKAAVSTVETSLSAIAAPYDWLGLGEPAVVRKDPSCLKRYTERRETRFEHAREIQQAYGLRSFSAVEGELSADRARTG